MQLMQLCQEIFTDYGLGRQLWLRPYRIVSPGSCWGLVLVLTDALSLDAIKKTPGYTTLPQVGGDTSAPPSHSHSPPHFPPLRSLSPVVPVLQEDLRHVAGTPAGRQAQLRRVPGRLLPLLLRTAGA